MKSNDVIKEPKIYKTHLPAGIYFIKYRNHDRSEL